MGDISTDWHAGPTVGTIQPSNAAQNFNSAFNASQANDRANHADSRAQVQADREAEVYANTKEAGRLASKGDFSGAQNALFSGGQLDAGFGVAAKSSERQNQWAGVVSRAANPDEYQFALQRAQAAGVDPSTFQQPGEDWQTGQKRAQMLSNYEIQKQALEKGRADIGETNAKALKENPILAQALKTQGLAAMGVNVPPNQNQAYLDNLLRSQGAPSGVPGASVVRPPATAQASGVPGITLAPTGSATSPFPPDPTPPGSTTAIGGAIAPGRGQRPPAITEAGRMAMIGDAYGMHPDVINTVTAYQKAKDVNAAKKDGDIEIEQVHGGEQVAVLQSLKRILAEAPPDVANAAVGYIASNPNYQAVMEKLGGTRAAEARQLGLRLQHQLEVLQMASRGSGGSDTSQAIAGRAAGLFMTASNRDKAAQVLDDAIESFSLTHHLTTQNYQGVHQLAHPGAPASPAAPAGEAKAYAGPGGFTNARKDDKGNTIVDWSPGQAAPAPTAGATTAPGPAPPAADPTAAFTRGADRSKMTTVQRKIHELMYGAQGQQPVRAEGTLER